MRVVSQPHDGQGRYGINCGPKGMYEVWADKSTGGVWTLRMSSQGRCDDVIMSLATEAEARMMVDLIGEALDAGT